MTAQEPSPASGHDLVNFGHRANVQIISRDFRRKVQRRHLRIRRAQRAERISSWLITLACQFYPQDTRHDRYREWTAELHYILTDTRTRPARRRIRIFTYSADLIRGALTTTARQGPPAPARTLRYMLARSRRNRFAVETGGAALAGTVTGYLFDLHAFWEPLLISAILTIGLFLPEIAIERSRHRKRQDRNAS
jgi:hypothetical protein